MPPKTKRQKLSAGAASLARETLKERRLSDVATPGSSEVPGSSETPGSSVEDTTSERAPREILAQFTDEWLKVLDRDDKKSLALSLLQLDDLF